MEAPCTSRNFHNFHSYLTGLAEKTIEQTTETIALVLKTIEVDESGSK